MRFSSIFKRTAMAAVVAASLASVVTPANALVFNAGDAVLVIYGNNNEGYLNLGNWDTLKTTGGTFDVSGILGAAGISGSNQIQYTVVGNGGVNIPMWFGNSVDIGTWTTTNKNTLNVNTYNTQLTQWRGQLGAVNDAARQIYSAADATLSFHQYMNISNTDTLAGTLNGRRGSSDIDQTLYLLERTGGPATLAGVTTGFLNSLTGQFVVGNAAPVPVPAAAVLFASGIVGLVGLARRQMSRLVS
jgi:hypothetical protein